MDTPKLVNVVSKWSQPEELSESIGIAFKAPSLLILRNQSQYNF